MPMTRTYMGANSYSALWHGLDDSWMSAGACAGLAPADRKCFFPSQRHSVARDRMILEAKMHCWGCPVQAECLEYALAAKMKGIWGGSTEKDRKVIIKARQAERRTA